MKKNKSVEILKIVGNIKNCLLVFSEGGISQETADYRIKKLYEELGTVSQKRKRPKK